MSRKKYIDRIDIELLNTLAEYPNYSIEKLGVEVELTPGPTHTRLRHLEDEGFYQIACIIDYSKFGLQEHVFSFKLTEDTASVDRREPGSTYKKVMGVLSKARNILVSSIDLTEDVQNNSHWITVHYYPMYSESSNELRGMKKKDPLEVSDKHEIQTLLKKFVECESGTIRVLKKHEVLPALNSGHVQRKKLY